MSDSGDDISIPKAKLDRIRERILASEKEKLNLDNPIGINDEIEQIIIEEVS